MFNCPNKISKAMMRGPECAAASSSSMRAALAHWLTRAGGSPKNERNNSGTSKNKNKSYLAKRMLVKTLVSPP
jgi:hypothetical protein